MNTPAPTPATHPAQTFFWLLKRELWEHRGGFLWAPLIIGTAMIAFTLFGVILAEVTAQRIHLSDLNLNFGTLPGEMTPTQIDKFQLGLAAGLMGLAIPVWIAQCFVVFFYLLGALYDDRRDRSVLFWKSLPISDLDTVLAKVAAAILLAPLLALAATIALHVVFLLLVGMVVALHHGFGVLPLLWNPVPLAAIWLKLVALISVNALWALPTVGWLLLCSAFARSKPFLWAVALPIGLGVVLNGIHLLQQLSIPDGWYWKNIASRILLGLVPGHWLANLDLKPDGNVFVQAGMFNLSADRSTLSWGHLLGALTSPDLWIGVVAGIGLIFAAIHFRRRRIETSV